MTFLTSSTAGFARWYTMYGDKAEIITPKELKLEVKRLIGEISNKLK